MKTVIIKEHRNGATTVISRCPDNVSAESVVNRFCKETPYFKVHRIMPPVSWRVAKQNDLLSAMIESTEL